MNYIGSKFSLINFLDKSMESVTKNDYKTLCDLFAGTSAVGSFFKKKGKKIIANDIQYYSYVLARHYIGNNETPKFTKLLPHIQDIDNDIFRTPYDIVCNYLNHLKGIEGFIYQNYCPGGTVGKEFQRQYFTDHNGKKCDEIRTKIEFWKDNQYIDENEYFCLLATLLESIDKYANTASVYGAFLKKIKASAQKDMQLKPLECIQGQVENEIHNKDINILIKEIKGDVLYLDPPYNHRQYATNYHLLETIARYDNPHIHGVTGLRDYKEQNSKYCSRSKVLKEFEELIMNADFKYIFLSYNNEGLMSIEDVKSIMEKRGQYGLFKTKYSRFKADKTDARNHKADHTYEYLHYVSII